MKLVLLCCALHFQLATVSGFWDDATSTLDPEDKSYGQRSSFFRWQRTVNEWLSWFYPGTDWVLSAKNRRTIVIGGLSIDMICIGTGTVLNRRTILTAANLIDPYWNRQRDLRIWLLGNAGYHYTPYRYRVWRVTRLFPKSLNPEHWHGPRGVHSPRHDICIIHSLDQMFVLNYISVYGMYPAKSIVCWKHVKLSWKIWTGGSGYKTLQHIKDNYNILWFDLSKQNIVDCSKYLPKYWGKFICMVNTHNYPGIQNGMGFHSQDVWDYDKDYIVGLGAFEIRYNEDRIMVFTDLRYYSDWIMLYAYIWHGQYYEYAYPQWGIAFGYLWNTRSANNPKIPHWQVQKDLYPMG